MSGEAGGIEVTDLPDGGVGLRVSGDPDGTVLKVAADAWHDFLDAAILGKHDGHGRP